MLKRQWLCPLVLAPLSLGFLAGCDTLGDERYYDDGDRYDRTDRYDDRYDRGNPRLGIDDAPGPAGAAHAAGVPRDAGLVRTESDTRGTVLSYRAPHPGRIYVYDRRNQRVIWSGNLRDGDVFSYSIVDNRGAVNGRNIFDSRGGDRSTDVQFYFDVRR